MDPQVRNSKVVAKALETLRLRIKSAEYTPGSALPAELDLAAEFDVSRGTIRKVIDILVASGELNRQPHSRPIISNKLAIPELNEVRELPIWVSRPVADGGVLSFLRGVSLGLRGSPYRMVVREPSRFIGQIVQFDERQFLQDLLGDKDFAGAILWRDAFARNEDLIQRLSEVGKPLIFVDIPPPDNISADYVASANATAARACVEYLFELGHSRIVFLADTDVPETIRERIRGFKRAMKGAGIANLGRVIIACEEKSSPRTQQQFKGSFARYTRVAGYFCDLAHRGVQQILAMDPLPTAIFASHDVLAANLCAVLAEAGINVPNDISVVGFDWLADCEKGFPDNLTTAAQSFEGFGLQSANLFLDRVSGEISCTPRHVLLDAPLVVRSSTAPDLAVPAFDPVRSSPALLPQGTI